jgi:hypothetical protein
MAPIPKEKSKTEKKVQEFHDEAIRILQDSMIEDAFIVLNNNFKDQVKQAIAPAVVAGVAVPAPAPAVGKKVEPEAGVKPLLPPLTSSADIIFLVQQVREITKEQEKKGAIDMAALRERLNKGDRKLFDALQSEEARRRLNLPEGETFLSRLQALEPEARRKVASIEEGVLKFVKGAKNPLVVDTDKEAIMRMEVLDDIYGDGVKGAGIAGFVSSYIHENYTSYTQRVLNPNDGKDERGKPREYWARLDLLAKTFGDPQNEKDAPFLHPPLASQLDDDVFRADKNAPLASMRVPDPPSSPPQQQKVNPGMLGGLDVPALGGGIRKILDRLQK